MPRHTEAESRAVDVSSQVGRFRFCPASGEWDWDEVTSHLHGLEARRRSVSTDRLLGLVHPADREQVTAVLGRTPGRFRIRYRTQASDDTERSLLVVGHVVSRLRGPAQLEGHAVDITADLRATSEQAGREAVEAAMEGRGAIEQAKGGLMLAYGLNQDQAFALLRWWSRNHNIRVRVLAERLMATVDDGRYSHAELRVAFDRVLHDLAIDPGDCERTVPRQR